MKTPSTILKIQIQSVETRYFSPQHTSPTATGSLAHAFFLSLPEHFRGLDQSRCNMLRQHISASVVPQPGAAPEPL